MIEIKKNGPETYDVVVGGKTRTHHTVTLSESYYRKLTGGTAPPEELLEKSFVFLLEREPNTSILSSFDLPLINRYFPEYEEEIKKRIKNEG
ncbi:MAG: hypothetical protein WD490_06290 [Opitutales bacterium]